MTTLHRSLAAALPAISFPLPFILMWRSGYVVGKLALPCGGPCTPIFIRLSSAAMVLLCVALAWPATGAPWPAIRAQAGRRAGRFDRRHQHPVHSGAQGEASKLAGLFHLIPAATALTGFVFTDEGFSDLAAIGFAITAAVYACTHRCAI